MKVLSIVLIALLSSNSAVLHAQLFGKLKNKITQKIEQKVEDKIVEEVSEEIANRAVRPINKVIDDYFKEQYKEQYGEDYDETKYNSPEESQKAMNGFMAAMYGNVELPPSYQFQYKVNIETYDYGDKKANPITMLVSTESEIFGMEQVDKNETKWIVFDFGKDVMAIYDPEKKTVIAISNVMKMAKGFSVAVDKEIQDEYADFKFEKMSKTKNLLNCKSEGYKTESKSYKSEFYVCNDLPFDWSDNFGKFVQNMAPNFYKKNPEYEVIKGMMLEATTERISDKKESKWITKSIDAEVTNIDNAEFKNAFKAEDK